MALVTIDVPLHQALSAGPDSPRELEQLRAWSRQLEAGDILFFPKSPVSIPADDLSFLLAQQQTGSKLHKNVAYKPEQDIVSGLDAATAGKEDFERLKAVMRRYSQSAAAFIDRFLAPYRGHWRLDYASFRPQEEMNRDLPLRRRNDLLHTDAFPTRPTRGARILRFFNNINPEKTRNWVVTDPFSKLVSQFAPQQIALPSPGNAATRAFRSLGTAAGLGALVPGLKRSPYDEFMMRFHNFLKENQAFQDQCRKDHVQFPPGSSWMVFTETVPHAVLSGQFALEQTFLVDHRAMVTPESSPLAVLESMTGSTLV
jgi:hypothetical protein